MAPLALERQVEELARPDAGGEDHALRRDRAARRLDAGDPSAVGEDACRRARLLDVRAAFRGTARVPLDDEVRRDVAGALVERRGGEPVDVELRDDLARAVGREHLRSVGREALRVAVGLEQEEVAPEPQVELLADLVLEALEPADRLVADAAVQVVREERPHAAGAAPGRAGGERVALDEDRLLAAELDEVVERGRAHDPAPDHHNLAPLRQHVVDSPT